MTQKPKPYINGSGEFIELPYDEYKQLSKARQKEYDKLNAIRMLHKWLKPESVVYTVVKHVSSSGMLRVIACYIAINGEVADISGYVADATESNWDDKGGVKVHGCGMDMGFHLVYTLSRILFKDTDGFESKDAGYALKQRWL